MENEDEEINWFLEVAKCGVEVNVMLVEVDGLDELNIGDMEEVVIVIINLGVDDLIDGEVEACLVEDGVENEFDEEISAFVEVGRFEVKVDSIISDKDTLNV